MYRCGLKGQGEYRDSPLLLPKKKCPAPQAIQDDLGFETAFDIDRTYRLKKRRLPHSMAVNSG